ncbi:MAG: methyltransferase domain-containing protein [bacterium]|jgi:SAM-dependent methyltransferase|nr:methyltransferase domain-containing protein [bacterium]
MSERTCPVCQSLSHQSFWYWDKEDQLMKAWAQDTRVHFSICRECGLIFQNPRITDSFLSGNSFWGFETESPADTPVNEPLEWLRQFTGFGKEVAKGLEVYSEKQTFHSRLASEGWTMKSVTSASLLQEACESPVPTDNFFAAPVSDQIEEGEEFDLICCFDGFSQWEFPLEYLQKLYHHLKPGGGLYIETPNALVLPRFNHICLTGNDICIYPFHTLAFTLYKAGFKNTASELCVHNRIFCTKIDPNPEADPKQFIAETYWGQVSHQFQRNFYRAWGIKYLQAFMAKQRTTPDALNTARHYLVQNPLEKQILRDMCGACLLFVEEIGHLKESAAQDWQISMARIMDVLKNDYALFDLLKLGGLPRLGTFPKLERFHYNEKMIYMATPEYFERFFSESEAVQLCDEITEAGRVVVGHLSSFL